MIPIPSIIKGKQYHMAGIVMKAHPTDGVIHWGSICVVSEDGLEFESINKGIDNYVNWVGSDSLHAKNVLVILHPTDTTRVYIDNFKYTIGAIPKFGSFLGKYIPSKESIGCIVNFKINNININRDCGIILRLTINGKTGVFYNLFPVWQKNENIRLGTNTNIDRELDNDIAFGLFASYLQYYDLLHISAENWDKIIEKGWFPFVLIQGKYWDELFLKLLNNLDYSDIIDKIENYIAENFEDKILQWHQNPLFEQEVEFLDSVHRNFERKDWISVISILTPRIEGLFNKVNGKYLKQSAIIDNFFDKLSLKVHESSNILPNQLKLYVEKIYLREGNIFGELKDSGFLHRNTLSHGLIHSKNLNKENAIIAVLLFDHLMYYPLITYNNQIT